MHSDAFCLAPSMDGLGHLLRVPRDRSPLSIGGGRLPPPTEPRSSRCQSAHYSPRKDQSRLTSAATVLVLISLLLAGPPWAVGASDDGGDWPQFLGPTRNGTYAGPALTNAWPKEGPAKLWEKKAGEGFSGPVVASGKFVLFHRVA